MKSKMSLIISQITIPYSNFNKSKKDKLFLSSLLFIVLIFNSQAQYDYIGEGRLDNSGTDLDGFVDYFSYVPKNPLRIINTSLELKWDDYYKRSTSSGVNKTSFYQKGTYYDLQLNPHTGLINPSHKSIKFKKTGSSPQIKLKASEINSFTIGIDSFFTIKNFYYKKKLREKPEFAKFIAEVKGNKYATYYHVSGKIETSYMLKQAGSNNWHNLSEWSEVTLKRQLLHYFQHIPYIVSKLNSEQYTLKNFMSMVKRAEYFEKHNNKTPIYFSKTNQELLSPKGAMYTASITNIKDSIYTFHYLKDSILMYEINYSSFYPNIKNGCFRAFDKNGILRKEINYVENKPTNISIYNTDSLRIKKQYSLITLDSIRDPNYGGYGVKKYKVIKKGPKINHYSTIIDDSLENVVIPFGTYSSSITNLKSKKTYFNKYLKDSLVESYRLEAKDTIFQITNDETFIFDKFEKVVSEYATPERLSRLNCLEETVLVSIRINEKRAVERYTILNEVDKETKNLTMQLLAKCFLKLKNHNYKISKGSNYKKGRKYETILPISFQDFSYYKTGPNKVDYNDMWMRHDMMMEQLHQNTIQKSTINIPNGGATPSFR